MKTKEIKKMLFLDNIFYTVDEHGEEIKKMTIKSIYTSEKGNIIFNKRYKLTELGHFVDTEYNYSNTAIIFFDKKEAQIFLNQNIIDNNVTDIERKNEQIKKHRTNILVAQDRIAKINTEELDQE